MKNILVPLFGIESDSRTLRFTRLLADVFGSHIACLHVRPGLREMAFATATVEAAGFVFRQLLDALEKEDRVQTAHAAKACEAFGAECGIPVCALPSLQLGMTRSYSETTGERYERIAAIGRTHDLVVFGRSRDAFAPTTAQIGDVLMRSGRPVLIAPEHEQAPFGRRIAIAWKDSAEAARAVTAAMPLLEKAEKVFIISAIETESKRTGVAESAQRLANDLKWHGIEVETRLIDAGGRGATVSINDGALEDDCDLLVMGAYGHSRMMEFVLGGVTRDVLNDARLPVFLFH